MKYRKLTHLQRDLAGKIVTVNLDNYKGKGMKYVTEQLNKTGLFPFKLTWDGHVRHLIQSMGLTEEIRSRKENREDTTSIETLLELVSELDARITNLERQGYKRDN